MNRLKKHTFPKEYLNDLEWCYKSCQYCVKLSPPGWTVNKTSNDIVVKINYLLLDCRVDTADSLWLISVFRSSCFTKKAWKVVFSSYHLSEFQASSIMLFLSAGFDHIQHMVVQNWNGQDAKLTSLVIKVALKLWIKILSDENQGLWKTSNLKTCLIWVCHFFHNSYYRI